MRLFRSYTIIKCNTNVSSDKIIFSPCTFFHRRNVVSAFLTQCLSIRKVPGVVVCVLHRYSVECFVLSHDSLLKNVHKKVVLIHQPIKLYKCSPTK